MGTEGQKTTAKQMRCGVAGMQSVMRRGASRDKVNPCRGPEIPSILKTVFCYGWGLVGPRLSRVPTLDLQEPINLFNRL